MKTRSLTIMFMFLQQRLLNIKEIKLNDSSLKYMLINEHEHIMINEHDKKQK